jgi:hypothetical protein
MAFLILSLTYRYIMAIQIAEKEIPMYRSWSFKRMPAKKDQMKKVKPAAKKYISSYMGVILRIKAYCV